MQEAAGDNLDKETKSRKKKCASTANLHPGPHQQHSLCHRMTHFIESSPHACTNCIILIRLWRFCRDKEKKKQKKKDGKDNDKDDSPEPSATEGGEDEDDEDEVIAQIQCSIAGRLICALCGFMFNQILHDSKEDSPEPSATEGRRRGRR